MSGTFLLGQPVYIYICKYAADFEEEIEFFKNAYDTNLRPIMIFNS
jgi:hypothetical protein